MLRTWVLTAAFVVVIVSAVAALVVSSREPVPDPDRPVAPVAPVVPVAPVEAAVAAPAPAQRDADRVVATGSGAAHVDNDDRAARRVQAERAAKLDALRNLIPVVAALTTDDGRRLDAVLEKAVLQGICMGFKVTDTKYFSDGSVDVVVALAYDAIEHDAGVQLRRPQ